MNHLPDGILRRSYAEVTPYVSPPSWPPKTITSSMTPIIPLRGNALMKRRNRLVQILLFIVTFDIYRIYWFYPTSKEMVEYKK